MTTTIMFNDGPVITGISWETIFIANCPVVDMNYNADFISLLCQNDVFDVANIFTSALRAGTIAHYFDFFVDIYSHLRRSCAQMIAWAFNIAYQTVYPNVISFLVNDTVNIDKTMINFCHSICLPMNDQEIERAINMVIRFDESHDLRSAIIDHLEHYKIGFIL